MCKYCERRKDIKFGWAQPALPYHEPLPMSRLGGNALEPERWDGYIYDYQTAQPQLCLKCPGYFSGNGIGTIFIPINYCPHCGRKLGRDVAKE